MASTDLVALRPYWHPVATAADVGADPHPVRLLDEAVVLVRKDDDTVNAFADLCVHRGAKISMGRMTERGLQCPYHGWTYDTGGRCVYNPEKLPVDLREELHIKYADAPGLALRRMLADIGVNYA